jgi:TrmH family RNA methyltransferase
MYLSSRSNPKIKFIRSLHQKKLRDQHRLFLIEGESLVQEALQIGWPLLQVVGLGALPTLPAETEALEVSPELMAQLTTLSSPPALLAVAQQKRLSPPDSARSCLLVTAPIQDPGNFGALLRLADAMNLAGVWVVGEGVDPYHPKVVRGAMGSVLRMPVRVLSTTAEIIELKAAGWTLLATAADGQASSFEFAFPAKTVFLLGSEGPGLPVELTELADLSLRIPIQARVESLNVVTAAAMLLHEYARQYPQERF